MVDPPDVQRLLLLHRQHGWGAKRIAKELGLARNTVRRYLRLGGYRAYSREVTQGELEAQKSWLQERFFALRGNTRVLLREVQAKGLCLSYSTLARFVKPWRDELAAKARATVRFETAPGQQMQVDFGALRLVLGGILTVVHFCVCTLGYSRRLFVKAFLAERQEHWLAALEAAFHHFGGVPHELLCDNARALVQEHDTKTGQVHFTETFLAFCRYHGTNPRACRPFRARTKGKVENGVKYVKYNALAERKLESFAALESHLEVWTREVADLRVHGTTHERPLDRFATEKSALLPLHAVPTEPRPLSRKVSSDCMVDVATNRYSVPHRFVGRRVEVLVHEGHVIVRADGVEIARHVERRERHRCIVIPEHVAGLQRVLPPVVVDSPPSAESLLAPYEALLGGAR